MQGIELVEKKKERTTFACAKRNFYPIFSSFLSFFSPVTRFFLLHLTTFSLNLFVRSLLHFDLLVCLRLCLCKCVIRLSHSANCHVKHKNRPKRINIYINYIVTFNLCIFYFCSVLVFLFLIFISYLIRFIMLYIFIFDSV